jgi:uncharacterized protein YjdB
MRATVLTHLVAALGSVAALVACEDSLSPKPSPGGAVDISVVPRTATIRAGQTVILEARMTDEFGDALAGSFSWKSSNDAVATVAATGEVYGRSAGIVAVTASASGKVETSTIHVLAREPNGKNYKPLLRSPIQ